MKTGKKITNNKRKKEDEVDEEVQEQPEQEEQEENKEEEEEQVEEEKEEKSKSTKQPVTKKLKEDNSDEKKISLSKKNTFLSFSNFGGYDRVDIREFYEKNGQLLPGQKGIALTFEDIETIHNNFEKIMSWKPANYDPNAKPAPMKRAAPKKKSK
ncbi:ssDNA-binding transcriptional regulator [Tieghemostelium lacteum]|uniref:SsDNA-binding transcriptional regulator n=1 Tax=Tieghemostelium lacteum TaxID=361077 RepID=A0A152A6Q9_TIELA|nr:ssDNA-binding transcriptional regulator [Tieghemostelium lacteum]|eukprot:KYR01908.1 ssDNA-binding transcriptional regulator [Tieghemostelium lacteum]